MVVFQRDVILGELLVQPLLHIFNEIVLGGGVDHNLFAVGPIGCRGIGRLLLGAAGGQPQHHGCGETQRSQPFEAVLGAGGVQGLCAGNGEIAVEGGVPDPPLQTRPSALQTIKKEYA